MSSDSKALEYAKKAGIETAVGTLGFLGPPGVLAAAAIRPGLERLLLGGQADAVNRVNLLMDLVQEQVGLTSEGFVAWAETTEGRRILAQSAFAAAYNAYTDQKIHGLARILVENIRDEASLELSTLLVPAIAALEAPHIRVLSAISEPPPSSGEGTHEVRAKWSEATLSELLPGLSKAIDAIVVVLRSTGLLTSSTRPDWSDGTIMYMPTPFGAAVLDYLKDINSNKVE